MVLLEGGQASLEEFGAVGWGLLLAFVHSCGNDEEQHLSTGELN